MISIYSNSADRRHKNPDLGNHVDIPAVFARLLRQQYRWLRRDGVPADRARSALWVGLTVGVWGGTFVAGGASS